MKKQLFGTGAVLFVAIAARVGAAEFSDSFDSQASLNNWVSESFATVTHAVDNGVLRLTNPGSTFAMSKHSGNFGDFTYRVKVRGVSTNYSTVGIIGCWAVKSDGYAGYMLTIAKGQVYSVSKWSEGRSTVLGQSWLSQINDGWNELAISKRGTTINFIINSVLVQTITDATSSSGEIGLTLGGLESAEFDDITVRDGYNVGTKVQYFADSFDNNRLDGWAKNIASCEFSVEEEMLKINANDPTYPATLYVDGDFTGGSTKVRIRFRDGDSAQFYGIVLMEVEKTFTTQAQIRYNRQTLYVVNADGEYGAGAGSYIPRKHSAVRGGGEWDTLEVTSDHKFIINGQEITLIDDVATFNFNAAGIWSGNGVEIEVDDFQTGDITTPIVLRPVVKAGSKSAAAFFPGPIYSLTGRLIRDGREVPAGAARANGVVVGKGFSQAILQVQK